jgi:hypothetical protein
VHEFVAEPGRVVRGEVLGQELRADALQGGVVVGEVGRLGHPEAARQEGLRRVLEVDPACPAAHTQVCYVCGGACACAMNKFVGSYTSSEVLK